MSRPTPLSQDSMVLYWEAILNQEIMKVIKLLEKKQHRLLSLRGLPFEQQSESTYRSIKALENEIAAIVGLISIIDELKNAYVNFSASIADRLTTVTIQRDYFGRELLELMVNGGTYQS